MFDPTQFATPASATVSPSAKFDPTKFATPATPGVFQPKSVSPFNRNSPNSQFVQPTPAGAKQMQYQPSDNTGLGGGFVAGLAEAGKGIIKGAAHTLENIGSQNAQVMQSQANLLGSPKAAPNQEQVNSIMPDANQKFSPNNTLQKIGYGAEQAGEFLAPGGVESDINKVAGGVLENAPKAVQVIGKLGVKAATSAGSMAGVTAEQGGSGQDIKNAALTGAALPIAGETLKAAGKGLAEAAIPTSAKEAKLIQNYKAGNTLWDRMIGSAEPAPSTAASTAFNKGLMGTESNIGVQAKRTADNLWNETISPALTNSGKQVDMQGFLSQAEKQIVKENPELSRQKDLLTALQSIKEDYAGTGKVDLNTLQNYKKGWATFVPEKAYKGQPIAGAYNDVKNILADNARNTIYKTLGPDIKQAYFDYGNLQGLQDLGQKAMTGGKLKGGFGSFWNGIKDIGLTPAGTIGGKAIYKTGNGTELYGKAGAKVIKDIISPPSNNSN